MRLSEVKIFLNNVVNKDLSLKTALNFNYLSVISLLSCLFTVIFLHLFLNEEEL